MASVRPKDGPGLTVVDGAMLGAGMMAVSGAAMFYRAKKTTPFKIAYFMSWPLLGGAAIRVFGPKRQEMEEVRRRSGRQRACIHCSRAHRSRRRPLAGAQTAGAGHGHPPDQPAAGGSADAGAQGHRGRGQGVQPVACRPGTDAMKAAGARLNKSDCISVLLRRVRAYKLAISERERVLLPPSP